MGNELWNILPKYLQGRRRKTKPPPLPPGMPTYIPETKAEIKNSGAGQWELKLSYLKWSSNTLHKLLTPVNDWTSPPAPYTPSQERG